MRMSILAIYIGVDPIFFTVGSFEVGWHGVIVALAVIVAIGLSIWFVRGAGVKREDIYGVAPWAIIGGL